ncbi:fasciclin-2-like isoform X3 [Leptotrombidium deliense]|uniref:Fasciclin-2-like isoform X3 n=1 Tax=Leptotrombidium deliense TaxID=299467 RepID=A0A443S2T0_9ACAR|nr:fasciclin-2-like isoform X3 [Leptotrombidium deliense]
MACTAKYAILRSFILISLIGCVFSAILRINSNEDIITIHEQRYQILCDLINVTEDEKKIQIKWLDAFGNEISKNGRSVVVEFPNNRKSAALVFKECNEDLSGNYTCKANVNETPLAATKVVRVRNIKKSFKCQKQLKLIEESDVKNKHEICNISVLASDYLTILKNGIGLTNSDYALKNNSLSLLGKVNEFLKGNYEIKLSVNGNSEFSQTTIVMVYKKPMITKQTKTEFNFEKNKDHSITCSASGEPKPNIMWFKNNKLIASTESLVFKKIKRKDAGVYTCFAENEIGNASKSTSLNVKTHRLFAKLKDIRHLM